MTRLVKLEKWGYKASKMEFSLDLPVRDHEYYRCFSVQRQKGEKMLLWRLHGAANPFISLIELFKLYALPTQHLVSRQLIRFIVRAWKIFRKGKSMKDFKLEFYYAKWQRQKSMQTTENEEINRVMESIQKLSDQQLDLFAEQYESTAMKENKIVKEQCAVFKQNVDQTLNKIRIIPEAERMRRLSHMCTAFSSYWKTQLLCDETTAYILTFDDFEERGSSQLLSLQQVLFSNKKQNILQISEQNIERISNKLLLQLLEFEYFNPNKTEEQSYPLDFDTVFIQAKKGSNDKLIVGNYCQLDFMQPFMKELGLTNQFSTIQNLIVFHRNPKPSCTTFTYSQTIKKHFQIADPAIISKVQLAIKWLLIIDYILVSRLKAFNLSLIETQKQKKKIIEALIGSQPGSGLHASTKMLINLIKLNNPQVQSPVQILTALTLQNIKYANQQEEGERADLFESNRYALIKNSIELKIKLFFEGESLKYFCQQNKSIKSLDSHGKYITMYLLANYVFFQTERQFLEIWNGQPVQFHDNQDPFSLALAKFIRITPKIEAHVDMIEKITPKWGEDIKEDMNNILTFCKSFKNRLFGSSCQNLTSKNRQSKLKEMEQMVLQIKEKLSYLFNIFRKDFETEVETQQKLNSKNGILPYLNGRKNLCLKQVFTGLSFYNYSQLFCEEAAIREYKPISSDTTKRQIKQYFDKVEVKLCQQTGKGSYFFQEMFTSLSRHSQFS